MTKNIRQIRKQTKPTTRATKESAKIEPKRKQKSTLELKRNSIIAKSTTNKEKKTQIKQIKATVVVKTVPKASSLKPAATKGTSKVIQKNTQIKETGGIPDVDKVVTNNSEYCVGKDCNGSYNNKYLSATLNKSNMANNNNKYYILQVLIHKNSKKVYLFKRWGRLGFSGVNELAVSI
jgi:hypothetical protein